MNVNDNIKIVGINHVYYLAEELEENDIDTTTMSDEEIVARWNEEFDSDSDESQDDKWGLSEEEYKDFLEWQDLKHMEDVLEEKGISTAGMNSDEVCEAYFNLFE